MRHLTQEERYHIYYEMKSGSSISSIATSLGRARSTIYQEVKRNTGRRGYRPNQAQALAEERWRSSHSLGPRKLHGELLERIEELLRRDWSPEQIAGSLALEGISIHHETIYRYIYKEKASGGDLHRHLRQGNRVYKKRYGGYDKRGKIANRVDIRERSDTVEERSEVGHWEGDTVRDVPNNRSIVTLVERKSRLTLSVEVASLHADVVASAIVSTLKPVSEWVESVTFDNGKEFSQHERISEALSTKVYFAAPYHSWQRGTNENTNGLLRQYIPKRKVRFEPESLTLREIEKRLNQRPRKCLGFSTPIEVFMKETGTSTMYH